ncbi:MAG: phage head closure protein [Emcibacter sp.]|nr:phage head closure protein [Emcibacter sp.]
MKIGHMRDRITIMRKTVATSDTGATETTDTVLATVWANVKPIRGREGQDAGRLATIQTYLVKIYSRDVTTADFISWGEKNMQIRSISDRWEAENETPGMFLTLECEDGVQT